MSTVERSPYLLPPPPEDFLVTREGTVVPLEEAPSVAPFLEGRVAHFSATSLKMLKMCPEQYRQRYILGRKERPGEALTLGTAFHSAIRLSNDNYIAKEEHLPAGEVVEYFHDKAWPDAVEKDGGPEEIRWDDGPEEVRRDGERMTLAYQTTVTPRVEPLATEQRIDLWVPEVPIPFIGYLDVEEADNVVDQKTGKQVQRKPDAHWRFQGAIYSLAKHKPTHFHSISRAKTPSIATPLTDETMVIPYRDDIAAVTTKVLQDYTRQVEDFMHRYGPDDPWPTTGVFMDYKGGPMCNYCGFRKDCPAWQWEREPVLP
jgi:PD-(D/E)XK nuclease superfamily